MWSLINVSSNLHTTDVRVRKLDCEIDFESSTRSLAPISSGPGDLFIFRFFNANNILLSVIVNSSIVVLVSTLGIVAISPGSSVVNTLAK